MSAHAPLLVHHAQLHPGERQAHGAADAIAVVGIGREHHGLAHAVALENALAGARLELAEGVGQQRRRTRDEQSHVRAGGRVEPGFVEQAHVHGGHTHEDSGARKVAHHLSRVELRQPDHLAAARERAVTRDEQPVHVKDRQCVQQHVARTPAPVLLERERIRGEVAVREHRALAATGGARGVENGREVVGATAHGLESIAARGRCREQRTGAVVAQREEVPHAVAARDRRDPRFVGGAAHDQPRLGVAHEVLHFGALVGRVQRQIHEPRAKRCQIEHQRLGRLVHLHRNPGATRQAQRSKQVCEHRARALEVGPGVEQALARLDTAGRGVGRKARRQLRVEVRVARGLRRAASASALFLLHPRPSIRAPDCAVAGTPGDATRARARRSYNRPVTAREALTSPATKRSWFASTVSRS